MTWWVAGATVVSGVLGSNAAENAAETQANAQRESARLQKEMFDIQNKQQTGFRSAGQQGLAQIGALGSGQYQTYDEAGNPVGDLKTGSGYLTKQFTPQDFAEGIDPGYAFRLKMGQDQAMRQANLGGGAISGNALTGLQDYTQGQASQEYGNAFNRFQTQRGNIYNTLASIAGLGQTSLGQTGTAGTQAGANIGQAISNAGSAAAAGQVGSANAISGGIQGAANQYYLNNLLKPQGQTFIDNSGWSGGGSGTVNVPGQGTTSIGDYFRT
jgi:hypothetical protein